VTHSLQLSSEESWCTVPYMVPMTSQVGGWHWTPWS
jgi:hypothetical protein